MSIGIQGRMTGEQQGWTFWVKGDGRVQLTDPDGVTTLHRDAMNANAWVEANGGTIEIPDPEEPPVDLAPDRELPVPEAPPPPEEPIAADRFERGEDGLHITLREPADIEVGTVVRIEATGNSKVNGEFTVTAVQGAEITVDNPVELGGVISSKGRITVLR